MFSPDALLDLDRTEHSVIFENVTHAWEALAKISTYLQFRLKPGIHGKLIGKRKVGIRTNNIFFDRARALRRLIVCPYCTLIRFLQ